MVAWKDVRRAVLGTSLVVLAGVPIVAHATKERREELAQTEHLKELVAGLQPMAARAGEGRRVFLNGHPVYFRMQTSVEPIDKALDAVAADCQSGDASRMLNVPETPEAHRPKRSLSLTKMIRQDGEDLAATLCVFHEGNARGEGTALTRYTLAHRNEDGRVSLFTVSNEEGSDLYAMFPEDADAPGGDFAGIPRPRGTKRLLAAILENDPYAVRIYEAKQPVSDMMKQYDEDMASAGWRRSEAVAREMPDTRFYTKGDERFVASFQHDGDAARVSIAPFQK